ncbi:MAG TPA: TIGR01212 family radical SAM protein [Desulfobacteraceae bacterium]|nr:TIGR01212 family radical SAM protein [Desulfobacteraceae bacterium]
MNNRYNDLNSYFRKAFGCRVQKISIDGGFSCPNRDGSISTDGCIFCNQKGSGTGAYAKGLTISEQIQNGQKFIARRYKAKKFLAYFQAFSNTYAPCSHLKKIYDEALQQDKIVGLSLGTRPDCVDESVLNLLQEYARDYLVWIEYGLQSVHDETLLKINRGHDFKTFAKAVEATKNRGIKICAHVILGLPGENRDHMLKTAEIISKIGIDGIKIHLLYVIKGTKLETLYNSGKYKCLGPEEYATIVCDFLEIIPRSIVIQRLTGDPHPDELVAPAWSLDRNSTFKLIKEILEKRDSWQGKFTP